MNSLIYTYIRTIAEEGSLTKAAAKLYFSQPYLSKILSSVETEFDVKLFERGKNPIEITLAGERFLKYTEDLLALEHAFRADIKQLGVNRRRLLRVGINPNRGARILPLVLPVMKQEYPNCDIEIYEKHNSDNLRSIENGDIDMGILTMNSFPEGIIHETIARERLLLALPPRHRLGTEAARGNFLNAPMFPIERLQELTGDTCITLRSSLGFGRFLQKSLPYMRDLDSSQIMYCAGMPMIYGLMLQGLGYAFLTELFIYPAPERENAFFYTLGDPPLEWSQSVAYKKSYVTTPESRRFLELIKESFNKTITCE
ncbi:MAG TPA: LysR family transcriptional regulator [Terriglobales bacterium]|nr:LysR family transcriptional regulator [Terriglobales bacterium]